MSVLSLLPEAKGKDIRKESLESVYSSNSRLNLLNKRKRLNPLEMSNQSLRSKSGDRFVTQRVLSAKTHRVKQLQNQLSDAHYHLQELSNENRVLRAIQKKQEIALQRYENSNAELPQVLNSHTEEMRIQQSKFKKLKQDYKELTQKLKEKDMQYQMIKDEHQHLTELSKDRSLLEREKLQAQVIELTQRVQQQNETISMLQRKITLEAKNFKHQLQAEINKHKDTRADLDMAITNADKLSTIIEMKEKMLNNSAGRIVKSPVKHSGSHINSARPISKTYKQLDSARVSEERHMLDQNILAKLCENSRNLNSALSHEEDSSASSFRYSRSRTNSTSRSTPNRKSSKTSKSDASDEHMLELAKTVQEGMADMTLYDDNVKSCSPDEMQKKMEAMKADLMNKIKNNDDPKKHSSLRRKSTEESIEEEIVEIVEVERPKSRGRRNSTVSFFSTAEETNSISATEYKCADDNEFLKPKRENSVTERKHSGKPLDKYCNEIIHDIEKSSKVIDKHVKQFNTARFDNDKIVQQLQAVDKINELVNGAMEIPSETLTELNNNFKILTENVFTEAPVARKRSISGRRSSKTSLLGDSCVSNQDMLDELLGKK